MMTEIVGVLTLLGLVFKVLRVVGCVGKCWTCVCRKKKKERKREARSSHERRESDTVESVEEVLKRVKDEGGTVHYNRSYRSHSLMQPPSESNFPHSDSTPHYIDLDQIHTQRRPSIGHPFYFCENAPPFHPSSLTLPPPPSSILPSPTIAQNRRIGRFGIRRHTETQLKVGTLPSRPHQTRSGSLPGYDTRSDSVQWGPRITMDTFYDIPKRKEGSEKAITLVRAPVSLMQ